MKTKRTLFVIVALLCASSIEVEATDSKAAMNQLNHPTAIPFTKNMGQWPDSILFRASANGATMWFTKNGVWYQFFQRIEKAGPIATIIDPSEGSIDALPSMLDHARDSMETTMIKSEFVGSSGSVEVLGLEEMDYKCNYYIGNDHSKWRSNVPNYGTVTMRGLYPGVDVAFSSKEGRLQEELIASANGDLSQVKVEYRGANDVTSESSISAIVQTSIGEHRFEGMLLADESESKSQRQVSSKTSSASGVSLVYSTYLGGSSDDHGNGISVDAGGNAYVTGSAQSTNFPTQKPFQASGGGDVYDAWDVFVTKLNSTGTGLIYSTYLGGSHWDEGSGIAVDTSGNAYVTGRTSSTNFPTQNPYQASNGGNYDVFITKLNSAGSALAYSTYLGGGSYDYGYGIAVDAGGNAYVTGNTESANSPTQNPFQASHGGGNWDAFVTKLNSTGSALVYSTYLGGSSDDWSYGIAVDAAGNAYVTGYTNSSNFPTKNPFQASFGGGYSDAFVTKLNSTGNALVYSTYLGGSSIDQGSGIAVDTGGNAYVRGITESTNFPTRNPYQASIGGNYDVFITKLNSAGSALAYSTYLGGSRYEYGLGIAVNAVGNAYVTGWTESTTFPTQNPYQASNGSYDDAFVTKLNSTGNALVYGTYLGGSDYDYGGGIAVDAGGNAYVTGMTYSTNFPTNSPFQTSLSGGNDAFVTKFGAYCCIGARGNADGDDGEAISIADITYLVYYMFKGGPPPACIEEGDTNGTGTINVVDVTRLVSYLFRGGPSPLACP